MHRPGDSLLIGIRLCGVRWWMLLPTDLLVFKIQTCHSSAPSTPVVESSSTDWREAGCLLHTHVCMDWHPPVFSVDSKWKLRSLLMSAPCHRHSFSIACTFSPSLTRHFWLLLHICGTVYLSTSSWHPLYQSSEHVWRPTFSHCPFHDCKIGTVCMLVFRLLYLKIRLCVWNACLVVAFCSWHCKHMKHLRILFG